MFYKVESFHACKSVNHWDGCNFDCNYHFFSPSFDRWLTKKSVFSEFLLDRKITQRAIFYCLVIGQYFSVRFLNSYCLINANQQKLTFSGNLPIRAEAIGKVENLSEKLSTNKNNFRILSGYLAFRPEFPLLL